MRWLSSTATTSIAPYRHQRLPFIPYHAFHERCIGAFHRHKNSRKDLRVSPLASMKVKFDSFQDMISRQELILVDFYATWCGPCQLMSQTLQRAKATGAIPKAVAVVKIDTEKYPAMASEYHVQGLPTLILFRRGKPLSRLEGAVGDLELQKWIQSTLRQT